MTKSRGIRERRGVRQEWLATAEPKNCGCGCGGVVTPNARHYPTVPDFLRGHHSRVKPPAGRPKGPPKPQQPCECGCGELALPGNRFVNLHGSRVWTDAARAQARNKKLGSRNPMFGKPAPNRLPPQPVLPCGCGCGETATAGRLYVSGHNGRLRRGRGSGRLIVNGYAKIRTPDHPYCDQDGYVLEHRLVAEHALRFNEPDSPHLVRLGNRTYLGPGVVVHHVDGDKLHNEPTNLAVMTPGEHVALHHAQGDIRS